MATAYLDVTGLSNSEVEGIGMLVENLLKEELTNKDIEVVLQDKELDEEYPDIDENEKE